MGNENTLSLFPGLFNPQYISRLVLWVFFPTDENGKDVGGFRGDRGGSDPGLSSPDLQANVH